MKVSIEWIEDFINDEGKVEGLVLIQEAPENAWGEHKALLNELVPLLYDLNGPVAEPLGIEIYLKSTGYHGYELVAYREPTAEELATHADRERQYEEERLARDKRELARIMNEHPDWVSPLDTGPVQHAEFEGSIEPHGELRHDLEDK